MTNAAAIDHVTAIVRRSGTSFYWGMRLLPRQKREAMYAVYAFCREVDDIADEVAEPEDKLDRLAGWRTEIDGIFAGSPETVTGEALSEPVREFGLRKEDFNDVIDGMETDAGVQVRIETMAELDLYCDRVACAVGRLSNPIFGVDTARGDPAALRLGQALQLTNILRDVDEDAAINRLYIPAEILRQHEITSDDPAEVVTDDNFPAICESLSELAGQRFVEAEEALSRCDRSVMRPAYLMLENYKRVLGHLRSRGWSGERADVSLGKVEKIVLLLRHTLKIG